MPSHTTSTRPRANERTSPRILKTRKVLVRRQRQGKPSVVRCYDAPCNTCGRKLWSRFSESSFRPSSNMSARVLFKCHLCHAKEGRQYCTKTSKYKLVTEAERTVEEIVPPLVEPEENNDSPAPIIEIPGVDAEVPSFLDLLKDTVVEAMVCDEETSTVGNESTPVSSPVPDLPSSWALLSASTNEEVPLTPSLTSASEEAYGFDDTIALSSTLSASAQLSTIVDSGANEMEWEDLACDGTQLFDEFPATVDFGSYPQANFPVSFPSTESLQQSPEEIAPAVQESLVEKASPSSSLDEILEEVFFAQAKADLFTNIRRDRSTTLLFEDLDFMPFRPA